MIKIPVSKFFVKYLLKAYFKSVIESKVFDYRGPKSSENPPKWTNSRLFTTQTRDRTVNINEQKT